MHEDLTLPDWINFVNNNHKFINSIVYSAGESLVNDDFFFLINYVRTNYPSISQGITSNGLLFERITNNPKFHGIYLNGIDEVSISLDFCDEELHNSIRKHQNAFKWVIKGFETLKLDKKKATLAFLACSKTLTRDNIDGLFPPKSNGKEPWQYDKELYKGRNVVERDFRNIKQFRRVYARYDKLERISRWSGVLLFRNILCA